MKNYQYKCTLLSDIIITSDASTEGYTPSLDYIPGSKFLGIVAGKLYDENQKEKTLDLFHNGKVRFGDAFLFYENENYLKAPFSWYVEKGKNFNDALYLHHKIQSSYKQLKQIRSGYFSTRSNDFITIEQEFSLKSAQDAQKRRSKDNQMFGYHRLKSGSEWSFDVKDETGDYAEEIKNVLEGKHRIGRSRSAEYGLVEIKFVKESPPDIAQTYSGEIVIYAKSNLCFINEVTGTTTTQPTAKQLCGDENAQILWNKCQVRSRNYKTWNRQRWNKDADRIIIERGSVFVVRLSSPISSTFFTNGIGSFKNEGFGNVLINPEFLKSDGETIDLGLKKIELKPILRSVVRSGASDALVLTALKNIKQRNDFDFQIDKLVNEFKAAHKEVFDGISKSQWGTLRNYGKHITKRGDFIKLIFDREFGFLYRGQSENEWRKKNRRVLLENQLGLLEEAQFFPFIIKLSNQMSKKK